MKKKMSLVLLLVTTIWSANAQPKKMPPQKMKKEQIKAEKIAFITKELQLTPEEAQRFWPVYNEYEAKQEAIHQEHRQLMKQKRENQEPTDKEAEEMLNKYLSLKQQELDIEKEYIEKFKQVLPVKKVGKLMEAEHKFKKELLKRIKEQHRQGPPRERMH
ncbi:MAG: hypothetical protein D6707_10740 [Bacteroidetes bacterium]|nr:MAG: hypothetical protein D6707_10740 [Bacteroidota bacterium]